MMTLRPQILVLSVALILCAPFKTNEARAAHGISLSGKVKYGPEFKHFDYVNPEAPKGGRINFGTSGTFDSLNTFVLKGTPAAGMMPLHPSPFYATLAMYGADDRFSIYGYIAEDIEISDDRASVTFTLRKNAKFHDGTPITSDDVVFTFHTLKEKGQPFYKAYYREVLRAETLDQHRVRFIFKDGTNKELPLIIGELPVLSKKFYESHKFEDASMNPPLGSGPYMIHDVDPGSSITYKRVQNWWGKDLPIQRGRHNADILKFIYFRDPTVAFQAFKAGIVDFRVEGTAKNWMTAYKFPAITSGDVKKIEIKYLGKNGMFGLGFNARKKLFQDIRVRKAISLLFDFEWANKNLFFGLYKRTNSYFSNSELASSGLPQGRELEILEGYRGQIPDVIFKKPFKMPVTDGSGRIRRQLRQAKALLKEAGWEIRDHQLIDPKTNKPFVFEILTSQADYERLLNGFIGNIKRAGIDARLRIVDSAQYISRMESFDFDMTTVSILQSESPGNEQLEFWGSKVADIRGSQNYMGIRNPVVDDLVEKIIDAQARDELVALTHALDRVLLNNDYVVPLYHNDRHLVAHWRQLKHPKTFPPYHLDLHAWWIDCSECRDLAEKYNRPQLTQHCHSSPEKVLAHN